MSEFFFINDFSMHSTPSVRFNWGLLQINVFSTPDSCLPKCVFHSVVWLKIVLFLNWVFLQHSGIVLFLCGVNENGLNQSDGCFNRKRFAVTKFSNCLNKKFPTIASEPLHRYLFTF